MLRLSGAGQIRAVASASAGAPAQAGRALGGRELASAVVPLSYQSGFGARMATVAAQTAAPGTFRKAVAGTVVPLQFGLLGWWLRAKRFFFFFWFGSVLPLWLFIGLIGME